MTTNSFPATLEIPPVFGTDMIALVADLSDRQLHLSAALYTVYPEISGGSILSIPCSTQYPADTKAMQQIRESVQELKPVSTEMLASPKRPMVIQTGSCKVYFTEQVGSKLLSGERAFLEEHQYDIETAVYAAIPFPEGSTPKGILFLFFYDEQDLHAFLNVAGKFSEQMMRYFKV